MDSAGVVVSVGDDQDDGGDTVEKQPKSHVDACAKLPLQCTYTLLLR